MKLIQTFFMGFAVGTLLCVLVASILESRKEPVPRLAIKCEYYLEVSEDSIWIESQLDGSLLPKYYGATIKNDGS